MFLCAKPVWPKGYEKEWNIYTVLQLRRTCSTPVTLHLAGTAFYRVSVNGQFLCFGPARTALGYLREDIFPLPAGA